MNEIKCPKCGEVFQVDESGYAALLKQVKDKAFEKEIQVMVELEKSKLTEKHIKERLDLEQKIKELNNSITSAQESKEKDIELALVKSESELKERLSKKDEEIEKLKHLLDIHEKNKELSVKDAIADREKLITERDKMIIELSSMLENEKNGYALKEQTLIESYNRKLKDKDEQIDYYKDLKTRMSTKLLGETLEQHCQIEFNKLRATGFRDAQSRRSIGCYNLPLS